MKNILLASFMFIALACSTEQEQHRNYMEENKNYLSDNLEYYKDTKTNVCYSGMNLRYTSVVLTAVTCTPEIERISLKFNSKTEFISPE